MNTGQFNAEMFIGSARLALIRNAIVSVLQLVGTVRGRVRRMAQINSTLKVDGIVSGRMRVNAKIASTLSVVGFVFSGTRRKVRSKAVGTLRLSGTVDPRIRVNGKIRQSFSLVGTVGGRVLHLVRADPIVSVLRLVGTVRGNDLATGPAAESRTARVPAQARTAAVPGDERLSEVA